MQWLHSIVVFFQRQPTAIHFPPGRQQLADSGLVEAIINQVDHALVFDGADDAARSLNNLLYARVGVAVVAAEHHLHALFDFFVGRVDLRQSRMAKVLSAVHAMLGLTNSPDLCWQTNTQAKRSVSEWFFLASTNYARF